MAFSFKVSTNKEDIKDGGTGAFLLKNGVHPICITFASVVETRNKAHTLNLNVVFGGKDYVLYGPTIQNKDGSPNTIGMSLVHKLSVLAGLEEGQEITTETETHEIGKDSTPTDLEVIPEFSDLECFIHLQEEYGMYDNKIQDRIRIRNVFDAETGASADELLNGVEEDFGKQKEITLERFVENITYQDGVTPEMVAEWKASKKSGTAAPKPANKTAARRSSAFGNRAKK